MSEKDSIAADPSSSDDSMTWDPSYCNTWNSESDENCLDYQMIMPERNEYKIVFISSSSDTDDDWLSSQATDKYFDLPELEEDFIVHVTDYVGEVEIGPTESSNRSPDVTPEVMEEERECSRKSPTVGESWADKQDRETSPSSCCVQSEHGGAIECVNSESEMEETTLINDSENVDSGVIQTNDVSVLDNSVACKSVVEESAVQHSTYTTDGEDANVFISEEDKVIQPTVLSAEETSALSTLEKYFTYALESGNTFSPKKQPSVEVRKTTSLDEEKCDDELLTDSSDIKSSKYMTQTQDILYSSESDASENSDAFSDNEDNSSDSSSDEATYIAPAATSTSIYNHMGYSLHTIMEESCEESDRGSRSTTPTNRMPTSELEKYFSLTIGSNVLDQKRASLALSEDDLSIISDSFSETSGSVYSETGDTRNEIDPAILAASRLEKYFTFGLLGNGRFCYPEDAEFTDESAGIGSETEDNIPNRTHLNSDSSLDMSSLDSNVNEINNETLCVESTEVIENAFVQDNNYDTVKRKKIKEKDDDDDDDEISTSFDEGTGFSTIKLKKKEDEVTTVDKNNVEDTLDSINIENNNENSVTTETKIPIISEIQKLSSVIKNKDSVNNLCDDVYTEYLDSICYLFVEEMYISSSEVEDLSHKINEVEHETVSHKTDKLNCLDHDNSVSSSVTGNKNDLVVNANETDKSETVSEGYPDEEARYIMNKLVAHFTVANVNNGNSGEFPGWEMFESQIAQLMQTVSPASLSIGDPSGSSCSSSTIGSNNSDYGSDTLESVDCTTTDDDDQEQNGRNSALMINLHPLQRRGSEGSGSGESTDSTISEETVYICKQLMQSLKKMVETTQGDPSKFTQEGDNLSRARMYITEQIIALMHTVSASRNGSPVRERKQNSSDTISEKLNIKEIEKPVNDELSPLTSELSNCSSDEEVDVLIQSNTNNTENYLEDNKVLLDMPKLDVDLLAVDEGISVDSTDDAQTIGNVKQPSQTELSIVEKDIKNNAISKQPNVKCSDSEQSSLLPSSEKELYMSTEKISSSISDNPHIQISVQEDDKSMIPNAENTDEENKGECSVQRSLSDRKKASSENNLLLADYKMQKKDGKVSATKSTGNISDLEVTADTKAACRDTGYYSLKSSDDSFLSLDESVPSQSSSTSLSRQKSLASTETILEDDEDICAKQSEVIAVINSKNVSLSSGNIPETVICATSTKSSTLPSSIKNKVTPTHPPPSSSNSRFRPFLSSFFSTSGVLRKLVALRDENNLSYRLSPRGRRGGRNRIPSGNEDSRYGMGSMPQLCIQECPEDCSGHGSISGSDRASSLLLEEENDPGYMYPSCSQISLSSFGSRSESMSSVYSAAGGGRYGTVTVTGEVLFGLMYNKKIGVLEVFIKECRNLAPVDIKRNRSDPYVKVYLLPDRTKSGKRKTKVRKHTVNPIFDEFLRFPVTINEVEQRTLWLSVWHSDMFGRNDFLGEVLLALGQKLFENSGLKWYPLQERLDTLESPLTFKGDLFLALKYVPADLDNKKYQYPGLFAKGALHVLMKEARNLMATRSNGTSDPFCKSYLLPDRSKASKQKTSVVKKNSNPKWYHTFVYEDVTLDDLKERCLELTLWDYDKITSNDFLGGVRMSLGTGKTSGKEVDWMDSRYDEVTIWRTMLERPNMWVEGCLLLRPTMQPRRI